MVVRGDSRVWDRGWGMWDWDVGCGIRMWNWDVGLGWGMLGCWDMGCRI